MINTIPFAYQSCLLERLLRGVAQNMKRLLGRPIDIHHIWISCTFTTPITFCNSSYSLGALMFSGVASIRTFRQFLLTGPVVHRTIIAKTKVQIGSTILIPGFPFWKKYMIHAARSTPHDWIEIFFFIIIPIHFC